MRYLFLSLLCYWAFICSASPYVTIPYAATLHAHSEQYRLKGFYAPLFRLRALPDGHLLGIDDAGLLMKTSADAAAWQRSWSDNIGGQDFAVNEDGRLLWLVGTKGLLSFSHDGGQHWERLDSGTSEDLVTIELAPDGHTLWAGGRKGTLLRSIDQGKHWKSINSGTTENTISAIYLSPDGQSVVVAGGQGYIASGEPTSPFLAWQQQCGYHMLRSLAGSSDGKRVVAVGAQGTICTSNDGGRTWTHGGLPNRLFDDMWAVTFDPKSSTFVASGDDIYRESRSGWTVVSLDWVRSTLFTITVAGNDQHLVAGGAGGEIISSQDSGKTWIPTTDKHAVLEAFHDVAVSDNGKTVAVIEADGYVWLSTDAGTHFVGTKLDGKHLTAVAVTPAGEVVYASTNEGELYHWKRENPTWQLANTRVKGSITSMRTNLDGSVLIATTFDGAIWKIGKDGSGAQRTWYQPNLVLNVLTVDQSGQRFMAGGTLGRVLMSEDGGTHWTETSTGRDAEVRSLAWDSDGIRWAGDSLGAIHVMTKNSLPWMFKYKGGGPITAMATLDGVLWWAEDTQLFSSYDRLLSTTQGRSYAETIDGLNASPGGHVVWVATGNHELGFLTRSGKNYPALSDFKVPKVLSASSENKAELSFTTSDLCALSQIKIKGFVSSAGNSLGTFGVNSTPIGSDKLKVSFVLPSGLPQTGLTLQFHTSCLGWGYMYSFDNRSLKSWLDLVPGGGKTVTTVVAALVFPLFSLLLYAVRPLWLLRLQQLLKSELIPRRFKAVAGLVERFLLAGFLCRRPRVLAAWVAQYRDKFEDIWKRSPLASARDYYVQLPVRVKLDDDHVEQISEPDGPAFAPLFRHLQLNVQIIGVAGLGKSTLAFMLGKWALDGSLLGHAAIPVLVDDNAGTAVLQMFDQTLTQVLGDNKPTPDFVRVLLSEAYLIPIVDRLSEGSVEFQRSVQLWSPTVRIVIITSRKPFDMRYPTLEIQPLPISSVSTLSSYVEKEIKRRHGANADVMRDTVDIVSMLVHTIAPQSAPSIDASLGQQITPLLASTFAALAHELIQDGLSLEHLPSNTASVYLEYIKGLLKQANIQQPLLAATSELGHMSVRNCNGPSAISVDAALDVLNRSVGTGNGERLMEHLFTVGILLRIRRVTGDKVTFVIDSFAEVLAAYFIWKDRSAGRRLEDMLRQSVSDATAAAPSASQTLAYVAQLRERDA